MTLGQIGRSSEEIEAYDHVISRFGQSQDVKALRKVAQAEFNKGVTLGDLGRLDEAEEPYLSLIKRFEGSTDGIIIDHVFSSMVNLASLKVENRDADGAMALLDKVIAECPIESEDSLSIQHCYALFNRGRLLSSLGRSDEAARALRSVIRKFGQSEKPEEREAVLKARRLLAKVKSDRPKPNSSNSADGPET